MLKFKGTRQAENIIYGTKESVINKILKLEDEGITDILISVTHEEDNPQRIYEIVKDIPKN
jgi:alkanesulfonate monooxygenase SsuD/methylene tetrahydromethanopterin reductase-like flavin-dependent oxidoreductase (luciferase family)